MSAEPQPTERQAPGGPVPSAFAAAALLFLPLAVLAPLGETWLLLLLALAVGWRFRNAAAAVRAPWLWLLLGLAGWAAVSTAWAVAPGTPWLSFSLAALFVCAGLVSAGAGGLGTADRDRLLRWAWVGFAAGAALLAVELLFGLPISTALRGTAADQPLTLSHANRGATVLVLLLWPLAAADGFSIRERGVPAVLAVAVLTAASNSTAAVAALAIGGAVYAAVLVGGATVVRALGLLTVAFVAAAPFLAAMLDPETLAAAVPLAKQSFVHRLYIWDFAADRILERPLLGWGLDASPFLPGAGERAPRGLLMPLHPHNAALQLWVELGVVGAAILAALTWACVRGIARIHDARGRAGAAAAFASAFVIASVSYGIWQNWWIATLALTAAFVRATLPARGLDPPGASPRRD